MRFGDWRTASYGVPTRNTIFRFAHWPVNLTDPHGATVWREYYAFTDKFEGATQVGNCLCKRHASVDDRAAARYPAAPLDPNKARSVLVIGREYQMVTCTCGKEFAASEEIASQLGQSKRFRWVDGMELPEGVVYEVEPYEEGVEKRLSYRGVYIWHGYGNGLYSDCPEWLAKALLASMNFALKEKHQNQQELNDIQRAVLEKTKREAFSVRPNNLCGGCDFLNTQCQCEEVT